MHTCKNLCLRIQAQKGEKNYQVSKRCSLCSVFIKTDDVHCPCCKYVLRYNVRTRKKSVEYKRI